MKKEIKSLTGIRGLAALYVAFYHFLEPFNKTTQYNVRNFLKHGYNSVDMFFILSGFVMTLSSKKLFDGVITRHNYMLFMKRRFARIYPIYLVLTLITFALVFKFREINRLLINLLLLQILPTFKSIVGPSWSLSAEWLAYLCFPFFVMFVYKYSSRTWDVICWILSFSLLLFVSLNNSNFLNGFQKLPHLNGSLDRFLGFSAILRCFSEYLMGIAIYKIFTKYKIKYFKYYHYTALPSFFLIIILLFLPNNDIVLVFLFCVLIFSLSTDTGVIAQLLSSAPIYFLGEISYSLYLIHAILVRADKNLYKRLLIYDIQYLNVINVVIFFIALILFSYIGYKFVEIPSRNFLRKKLES